MQIGYLKRSAISTHWLRSAPLVVQFESFEKKGKLSGFLKMNQICHKLKTLNQRS